MEKSDNSAHKTFDELNKSINSVYSTFLGGYCGFVNEHGKRSKKRWEYTCCYGIIRFCKGIANGRLTVPGVKYSLHINTYAPYCNLPKFLQNYASDHHIAFIKQWPFVVIGFENVVKYMEDLC